VYLIVLNAKQLRSCRVLFIVVVTMLQGAGVSCKWRDGHDPTDWVVANYPWPAVSSTRGAASGLTETETAAADRRASLLRLRPDDLHAASTRGPGCSSSQQLLSSSEHCSGSGCTVDGHRHHNNSSTEQSQLTLTLTDDHDNDDDDDNVLTYHQHQQHQRRGNHDNELVIDPLVG